MRRIFPTVVLVLVYLAALGSVSAADLGLGVALAVLVQWSVRPHAPVTRRVPAGVIVSRAVWLVPFLGVLFWRGLANAASFLPYLLRPSTMAHAGLVEIPYGERTELGVAVTALCICLSPGSIALEMDDARRVLIVQAADARDPDRIRDEQARFYERWQRRVAP